MPADSLFINLLFGERAAVLEASLSPRLLRWSRAFDQWLAELRAISPRYLSDRRFNSWAEFLDSFKRVPWEVCPEDVCAYRDNLAAQGYADSTITKRISDLSNFYEWCRQRQLDPQCAPDFNPAGGVQRPRIPRYGRAQYLLADEARALLAAAHSDPSILGKRDYAFFLARLTMGVPLNHILRMQWQDFSAPARSLDRKPLHLPPEVRQAITDYLEVSGRLQHVQPADYIFAPLRDALSREASGDPLDWDASRPLQARQMLRALHIYGRVAGLVLSGLTLSTLRHTAAMLRLEAGDTPQQLQEFLQRPTLHDTNKYLRKLAARPVSSPESRAGLRRDQQWDGPERKPHRAQPFEGLKNGLQARLQPPEELAAIMAEDITGLQEEIAGMRIFLRVLIGLAARTGTGPAGMRAVDVYGAATNRLAELLVTEKFLAGLRHPDRPSLDAVLRDIAREMGDPVPDESDDYPVPAEDPTRSRNLSEEIAGMRLVLRRTLARADTEDDDQELLRLATVYHIASGRLIKLLRVQNKLGDDREAAAEAALQYVLTEIARDMGFEVE